MFTFSKVSQYTVSVYRQMKFKHTVTLLFLFSFSIYNLCPVLVQGHCGFPSDSRSAFEISLRSTLICDRGNCGKGAENTPQPASHRAGNCCAVGLQLARPSESHAASQTLQIAFPLIIDLPSLSTLPHVHKVDFRPDLPSKKRYAYFPVHHLPSRAPPLFLS